MNDVTVLAASADTRRGLTIGLFLVFIAITLYITFWASRQNRTRRGLLRRRPVVLGLPERPGDRRRLHVRRLVPRHRRADRAVRLRRLPLLDRLPGRVAGRAAAGRRADAQLRPLHDGRRARVPDAAAAGPDGGRHLHHHRVDLLPDRPDGRCRRAGGAAAGYQQDRDLPRIVPEHGEERHHRARRRADDPLRHRRRHARHHLGADDQGRPADDRRDPDVRVRAGQVQLQPVHPAGRGGPPERQGRRVPQPRPPVRRRRLEDQGRPHQPRPRPGARHRRPAAHPHALLHGAHGQGRPPLGQLGDRPHRRVLPAHPRARLRRRGAGRHEQDPCRQPRWQHGGPAAGRGARRRHRDHRRGASSWRSSPRSRSPRSSPWSPGSRWRPRRRWRTTSTPT